jgi:homoserine O-acetyltransferase
MTKRSWLAVAFAVLMLGMTAMAQEQKFANLGSLKLENGAELKDCRIGYRTLGTLNADKSNVIIFPTWASGTTEQLLANVGPGKLADSSKYFVVLLDAFANGVSSSPSNSTVQPHMKFPKVTIRDMVNAHHKLLTDILHIDHVYGVMGISMGGMQTFQWMVAYPDFIDKAVPIMGSPRLTPYDLLMWQTEIDAITHNAAWQGGDYKDEPAALADKEFSWLLLTTPAHFNATVTREELLKGLAEASAAKTWGFDANNKIRQAQAMMALDVTKPFGGSIEQAARSVKAKVLVIVGSQDHVVNPAPALEFAKALGAKTVILEGDCGHLANSCESEKVVKAAEEFLK